jgi:O-antigen ligase
MPARNLHYHLALFCIILMMTGMMVSRAFLSIGMAGIFLTALFHPDLKKHIRMYFSNPALWAFGALFLVYPVSLFWSDDWDEGLIRVNARIAFLLLPFGFLTLRNIKKQHFYGLLYYFVVMIVLTSLFVLGSYLLSLDSFSEIYNVYKTGRVMKTPYSHVRYSLLAAFAVFTGGYLYLIKAEIRFRYQSVLLITSVLFLIIFLHLLAVRSGLLALYTGGLFVLFRYAIVQKKWIILVPSLLIVFLVPLLSYKYIPSFQGKINYMIYDWNEYLEKGNTAGLSDATRLLSMERGIQTGIFNFWLGTGIGDLKAETDLLYKDNQDIPPSKRLPHNQFIWVFASTGIIGLGFFLVLFFYAWLYQHNYRNPMISLLYIFIITSFITEATVEEQIGSCFFLIFVLLFNFYQHSKT